MNSDIDQYIEELQNIAVHAELNYEIWWVYRGKETEKDYGMTMRRYNMFFQMSIHAHFVTLLVELYKLYENNNDSYNFNNLVKRLRRRNLLDESTLKMFENTCKNEAMPLWYKVHLLRNKIYGHRAKSHTVEDVFNEVGVKPQELKSLIEVTKKLINQLYKAWNNSTHVFNLTAK